MNGYGYDGKEATYDASISLVGLTGGTIYVWGDALWRDHTGELEGMGELVNNYLKYDHDGCSAHMKLKDKVLIVKNGNVNDIDCGGANVTFNGIYKKK